MALELDSRIVCGPAAKVLSMVHPQTPSGVTNNVFTPISPTVSQSVLQVSAQLAGTGGPIVPPRAPSQVQISGTAAQITSGIPVGSSLSITISGTIDSTGRISVNVLGAYVDLQCPLWIASDAGITSSSTAAQVATSLANWINNSPLDDPIFQTGDGLTFSTYFYTYATGNVVTMVDKLGLVAHLELGVNGNLTVSYTSAPANILNVMTGRQYAIAYADTAAGFLTELSAPSASSGPSAAYGSIMISDIPASTDSRINQINIYAYPDGKNTGTPHLIGTVTNPASLTGLVNFTDMTTEATLATNALYPGPNQPTAPGAVTVELFTDGTPWVQIYVPANASQAVVNGLALFALPAGCVITANVNNLAGSGQLVVEIS